MKLIVSYPNFAVRLPIPHFMRGTPMHAWFADQAAAVARDYVDDYNDQRDTLWCAPVLSKDLEDHVRRELLTNKVAIVIHVDGYGEPTYLYNHDGSYYLCSGLKEQK